MEWPRQESEGAREREGRERGGWEGEKEKKTGNGREMEVFEGDPHLLGPERRKQQRRRIEASDVNHPGVFSVARKGRQSNRVAVITISRTEILAALPTKLTRLGSQKDDWPQRGILVVPVAAHWSRSERTTSEGTLPPTHYVFKGGNPPQVWPGEKAVGVHPAGRAP